MIAVIVKIMFFVVLVVALILGGLFSGVLDGLPVMFSNAKDGLSFIPTELRVVIYIIIVGLMIGIASVFFNF